MDPEHAWRRVAAALLLGVAVGAVVGPSVNALPGFSDHTGPARAEVTALDRLDAGCVDRVGEYSGGSTGGGEYTRVALLRTADTDADLSAWVERTSSAGADLSTFRVHVDSRHDGPANATCETVVKYRVTVTTSGGSDEGLVPDAHGTRVQWMENGRHAGCSASHTSPLDGRCPGAGDRPPRTWANASAA